MYGNTPKVLIYNKNIKVEINVKGYERPFFNDVPNAFTPEKMIVVRSI